MIEIIKDGKLDDIYKMRRFTCSNCGCIFKADNRSYVIGSQYNESYITIPCPYCGESVSRNYEDHEA